jgi:hypothetical protein
LGEVNAVVGQPSDHLPSAGLVHIADCNPSGFVGLQEIENRFATDFPGGTQTKYFHW